MMRHSAKQIRGYAIQAEDGLIGEVHDFFFDDQTWTVRYLVADTGRWLPGRLVLLPPLVLRKVDADERHMVVSLTRKQVQESPDVDTDKPVSRQHEIELYSHYGWPPYWPDTVTGIVPPVPVAAIIDPAEPRADQEAQEKADPHLRSMREAEGYRIHCIDGDLGHAEDFLIGSANWAVRALIIDTRNWLPGRRVIVPPSVIQRVSWAKRAFYLDMIREEVRQRPEFNPEDPDPNSLEPQPAGKIEADGP